MKIRLYTIPNFITLCNLLCGCGAMLFALKFNDLQTAFWLIIAAAVFDFMDGFVARLTKQYSEVGVQLDSLADMVSFGAAPSSILFCMYYLSGGTGWIGFATFILAAFSALRLAKFNVDTDQKCGFIGMPTPAAAIFVASVGYLFSQGAFMMHPIYAVGVAVVLSYFLVSDIPMFALKFTNYSFSDNKLRYIFIICSVVAIAILRITAIPFIIVAYLLVSIVSKMTNRR